MGIKSFFKIYFMADQSLFSLQQAEIFVADFKNHLPANSSHVGIMINSFGHTTVPKLIGYYIDASNNEQFYTTNVVGGCPYPPHCINLTDEKKLACLQKHFEKYEVF